jgi:hypothetical protein
MINFNLLPHQGHAVTKALLNSILTSFICLMTSMSFAQSPHTVAFTGSQSDFNAAELFDATSGNVRYYATYDAGYLYLGAFRTSGTFAATDNFTAYLDTDPQIALTSGNGTTIGQSYNGVTGSLPFSANYNVHVEQFYQEARSFGSSWAATISGPTYFTSSTCREVAIPISSIGNPYGLYLTMWMGYSNGIFANAPGASLGNGANPTVVNYFGGIGLRAADCAPLATQNQPIVDLVQDGIPTASSTIGTLLITTGSVAANTTFAIAPGGSIEVVGGTLDLSSATISFGGSAVGNYKGTSIDLIAGNLITNTATVFNVNGSLMVEGLDNTYNNKWTVQNKLTLLPSGGVSIGNGGVIDLRNGGFLNANAPTYLTGSTLSYNTGSSATPSLEWTSGITSGIGVPNKITIGNLVANSSVNFGSITTYRQLTDDLTIANNGTCALTLSSAAGGDLRIGGDFTQGGTFTSNARSVIFTGNAAQTVSGTWNGLTATNNFTRIIVENTNSNGVTLSSNTVITASSGAVLALNSVGRLSIGTGANLNFINNGGTITAQGGIRTIRLNGSTSSVTFTGSKSVQSISSGSLSLTSLAAGGVYNLLNTLDFGASLTTIGNLAVLRIDNGGSVLNNAPIYASGATLQYNTGAAFARNLEWSSTSGAGYPHHVIISTTGTALNLGNGGAGTARQMGGDLTINNGCALSMVTTPMTASLTVLGNITVGSGISGTLTLSTSAGGNLAVGGNLVVSAGGTFTHNNRSVTCNGTANQNITGISSLFDLIINNAAGVTINTAMTVSNVLTMTAGTITLGNNNLLLSSTAVGAITGTFGNTRMIITNGTGQFMRAIATTGFPLNYTWPVGENTGTVSYSPVSINFTANNTARNLGVVVVDANHPQLDNTPAQTDYISRYWSWTNSAAGNYTYTMSSTFVAEDVVGASANLRMNSYASSVWRQDASGLAASNVLTSTTGLTQTTGAITSTTDVTARVNNGATYTWNQTGTQSFTTAANWTPNRTTLRPDDILVFSNGATTTVNSVPTQTIGKLLVSGNTNVTFISSADVTLTISGNNGDDLSVASGSTAVLASTGNNAFTMAFSNAVTAAIAGTFSLNSNTANDNRINFTNATATVTGVMNNFGVITSTAGNLTFASGSQYNHNYTSSVGTIPTALWDANSTCRIQGYTSGGGNDFTPLGISQSFGNFTWNCAGQTNDAQLDGLLTSIQGNFTVSATNGSELRLTDNTGYTLNIGGNLNLINNNSFLTFADGNGTYNAIVNVGGSFTQTNTTILEFNNGDNSTSVQLLVAGGFTLGTGAQMFQSSGGTNGNVIEWDGTASQAVTISGALPYFGMQMHYRLNNPAGMTLTGTIPVNGSSTFYRKAGAITGGTITYNNASGTLEYEGTEDMTTGLEFPTANGPVNVRMNKTGIVTLAAARSLPTSGVFTNLSGIFSLGAFDLTLNNNGGGALVNASPSATNMIAASGAGQLKLTLPNSSRDLFFHVGDITNTPEYSGIRMNFSANSVNNRVVGIRVVDDTSAVLSLPYAPIDYLTRHWIVTLSSTSGSYSYIPSLVYDVAGDVEGTENNLQVAAFPSGASSWNHYTTTITSPRLTKSGAALTNSNFSLNNAIFTGRTPVKYWDGSISTDWNTANNWTPTGVPASTDNIDINGNAINPCVLGGNATINHLTLSDGANFTLNSGTLTVGGNFTYDPNATAVFNCASTLSLTNTTFPQVIPALQYGNLSLGSGTRTLAPAGNISICGNYTPTSGTVNVPGSTVIFNGTATQSILSNNTSFNNLIIANTSADVTTSRSVTIRSSMSILPNARYNQTNNTLSFIAGTTGSVDGFLRNRATITTTGVLTFNNGGTYEHDYTNNQGTVPTSTWSAGSTCKFIGYTSNTTAPAGLNQAFHHVEWNCPSQTDNLNLTGGLTDINGDFRMVSSGSGQLRLSSTANTTINIDGDMIQSGGELALKSGNGNQTTINVGGDFIQTGGSMDGNRSDTGTSLIRLVGNFERTGSGDITTSGLSPNMTISFVGSTQSILQTSTGDLSYCNFTIASGSTTSLLGNFALNTLGSINYPSQFDVLAGGTLDCGTYEMTGTTGQLTRVRVNNNATIRTAHIEGLTASSALGSVKTENRTYDSGATYVYNGTANQNTGDFWNVTSTLYTVANLVIDNSASKVTLNNASNVNVSNALTFTSGNAAYLDVVANTISVTNPATTAVVRNNVGHVVGNLSRAILPSATNAYTFHVGTASAYAPVVSNLNMGAGNGAIRAKAIDGVHPQMASDGLSQTAYCNRYWTMTNIGATVNSASHEFNYQSADLIGGATSSLLSLARYSSGWTYPTFTTGVNSITGTALNNTSSFGDFFAAVGCTSYLANITAGGATTFCAGGTVNLSASANIAGSNFVWSPSTGLDATTGSSVNASPSVTTTYTVTATSPQNCSDTETITVTVNPFPATPAAITGTATVCQGQNGVAFSVPAIANATGYTWTLPTGATIASGSNTNSITVNFSTTAVSGVITVRGTNACGNGTISANYSVTVNPLPAAAGTITGTATVCQGQNAVAYSVPAIANATGYTWTLPTGATIASGSNTNSITVNFSTTAVSGVITVRGTNACGNGTISANYSVTVNPLPAAAGTITGTATVCQGQNAVAYSVPAIANATGYTWTLPTGASIASGSNTNSITVNFSTTAVSGVITVRGTNACGNGTISANYSVTVNPLPAAAGTITGTATVCQGQNGVAFSVPAIANATGYTWTLPTGATIASGSNTNSITVNFSTTAVSGVITVRGTNACGNGAISANYSVTVNPLPAAAGTITGTATVCQGQNAVAYSVPAIANATGYTWTLPTGATIASGSNTNSITVNFSTTAVSGVITVRGTNACGNGTISANYSVTVNPLPASAGTITGTATVCQGQNGVAFSVPAIANATGYTWTLPTGATIASGSNTNSITVNFSSTAVSGVITVRGTNACGNGTISANFAVTVNPLPAAAGTITGSAAVCQSQNGVAYSVPAIANATGYTWTLPTGATIASGSNTNSITVNFSSTASPGVITVAGSNACGNGTISANFAVSINPNPAAAGTIVGTATVCPGENGVTYSVPAIANATGYDWTLPSGATIASGSNTNSITVNFATSATAGVITVRGTNACGNGSVSANFTISLNPLPAATVSGPASACNGASASFVISGNANAAVYYTINGGATMSILTNDAGLAYVEQSITAAKTLQLVAIEGDFCTTSLTGTWTIQPTVLTASISGSTAICAGQSTTISFSGTPNAVLGYQVNGGATQIIVLNGAGTASVSTGSLFNNRTYQLVSVQLGACNYALSTSAVVTVLEQPDATFIGGGAVCGGSVQIIQVVGSPFAVVSYTINGGSTQTTTLSASGIGSITTAPLNTNTSYHLVSASNGSCSNAIGVYADFTLVGNTYYADLDGDGVGNTSSTIVACTQPAGYSAVSGDCNDDDATLNPYTDWYADMDGDGYGSFIFLTDCENPGVPGVTLVGGDCDDTDPLVHAGVTEVCGNGIDDNCNGAVDEGCELQTNDSIYFATNIQSYLNQYPLCNVFTATTAGATNSPESNSYAGRDRWYKFQATTSACRIALTTSGWDGAMQLCNQAFAPIAGFSENAVAGNGDEIMIRSGLTPGQWYYLSVGGASASEAGNFSLCLQQFVSTSCATPTTSQLNLCSQFKAVYNGATAYTYNFSPVNAGMGGGSVTFNGPIVLSNAGLNLYPGQSYQVSINSIYSGLTNGAGQVQTAVVVSGASNSCTVTIGAHSDITVRSSQTCDAPATLVRATVLRTDPFVCGVVSYTYEFTPTSGCTDFAGTGTTFTYTNVSRNISLNFNGTTTTPSGQSIMPQTYYKVRIRPNFGVGGTVAGVYGTARIIFIGGTLMTESTEESAEEVIAMEETPAALIQVYPNPGQGDAVQLESLSMTGDVTLALFDQFGRLVETQKITADAGFYYTWLFESNLANGLYHIQLENGGQTHRVKWMVSK